MSRIKELREKAGMTQKDLAKILNLKQNTISGYERGVREPDKETLKKMAEIFKVPIDYILEYENNDFFQKDLFQLEKEFEAEKSKPKYYPKDIIPLGRTVKIPLLGKIPAGQPIYAEENILDYIDTPIEQVKNGEYFYLQVVGDSMIGSRIHDGDRVLVRLQPDVESGEIAVVRVNAHDATLKRVKKIDGQVILYPDNPAYEPIFVKEQSAEIIGKVVKVEFEPKKRY